VAPRYKELAVKKLWEFVQEIEELYCYFPDYNEGVLPERDYLFTIISTLKPNETKEIIEEARNQRSVTMPEDDNDYIELTKEFKEELFGVMTQKVGEFTKYCIDNKGKSCAFVEKVCKIKEKKKRTKRI
jgi:hypothetical protein